MSKGNVLLGYARGKIGDIVLSRLDGEQIARARNRHPKNPKTERQLYQRAIMATVMRAYSAGQAIFDHSFQGKSVPNGSMRRFLSVNAKKLRAALAADVENQPATNWNALVNGPGTLTPVANAYRVSEGSLTNNLFTPVSPTAASPNGGWRMGGTANSNTTLAEWAASAGLVAGDIYTFVFFAMNEADEVAFRVQDAVGVGGVQMLGMFGYVRLIAKDLSEITTAVGDALMTDVFDIDATYNVSSSSAILSGPIEGFIVNSTLVGRSTIDMIDNNYVVTSCAIIRSDVNSVLRSTADMVFTRYNTQQGINWQYALAAWQQGSAELGDSELILEGSGLTEGDLTPSATVTGATIAGGAWGTGSEPQIKTVNSGVTVTVVVQGTNITSNNVMLYRGGSAIAGTLSGNSSITFQCGTSNELDGIQFILKVNGSQYGPAYTIQVGS